MQDDGSDAGSVAAALPQEHITMLLNKADFQEKVCQDPANLCCVIVTSTLCPQCGIRRIPYPKVPKPVHNDDDENVNDDEENGEAEDDDAELDPHNNNNNNSRGGRGRFYSDVEQKLVKRHETAVQRRHVRFFHVCACAESETCIDFLVAADPAYRVLNKKPTEHEIAQLHKSACRQLHELLATLEVRSTPFMRFYLGGQPLRYSSMASSGSGGGSSNDAQRSGVAAAMPRGVTDANDVICAAGANVVKWARVLENAVVVRNEVMRAYDEEEREEARLAKAEANRLAREARKREEAGEGEEEEEEDDE